MKKIIKRIAAMILICFVFAVNVEMAEADSVEMKSFISFGADLKPAEKATVMKLLGVTEEELTNYTIVTITNREEHKYLDGYLSADVIGTRALSSVKVEKGEEGSGIGVDTENITYCSGGMYCNALITAGVEDAMITVAGPFKISGTAALVGVMKSYEIMTGEKISEESADAATNELVVTGELGESVGNEEATNFFALAKQKVLEGKLSSEDEMEKAVDEAAESVGVELSAKQKQKVVEALDKIKGLDLDTESLKEQAKDIYNQIKDMGIGEEQIEGFFAKLASFFSGLWDSIANFFSGHSS